MTKKKFVPLFTEGGTEARMAALLPGRHPCQCLAVRHRLVNNCTNCGRIVCEQEGPGSCYFCGKLVLSSSERKYIETGINAAQKYLGRIKATPWAPGTPTPPYTINRPPRSRCKNRCSEKVNSPVLSEVADNVTEVNDVAENASGDDMGNIVEEEDSPLPDVDAQSRLEEGLVKAMLQRDKLLHFDATSAKRTQVIDDELDYFVSEGSGAAAVWLDPQTRARVARRVEELREQRHALRSQAAFGLCINFKNMTVTEQELHAKNPAPTEEDLAELGPPSRDLDAFSSTGISDPLLSVPTPQFIPESLSKITTNRTDAKIKQSQFSRVQDADQQKTVDRGFCLSLHQPWASLLVRGVKIHEGRSWYSSHRGPLWIAAAAKTPDEEEVRAVVESYLERGARETDLPTTYPTGVLLGCVNVDDVLPQKEYRIKFPDGESESPYVFVCSDPRELLIKLPMTGQHKIYRLESHIHAAAKANLT